MADSHEVRADLHEQFGQPMGLGHVGDVYAFAHQSREAAEAFAAANREHYGYPAWVERREVWVDVVDLGISKAGIDANFQEAEVRG